jgi:hypothetical protein
MGYHWGQFDRPAASIKARILRVRRSGGRSLLRRTAILLDDELRAYDNYTIFPFFSGRDINTVIMSRQVGNP